MLSRFLTMNIACKSLPLSGVGYLHVQLLGLGLSLLHVDTPISRHINSHWTSTIKTVWGRQKATWQRSRMFSGGMSDFNLAGRNVDRSTVCCIRSISISSLRSFSDTHHAMMLRHKLTTIGDALRTTCTTSLQPANHILLNLAVQDWSTKRYILTIILRQDFLWVGKKTHGLASSSSVRYVTLHQWADILTIYTSTLSHQGDTGPESSWPLVSLL